MRKVEVDQLVGATEIGHRLGLRRSTHVHQLRKNDPTFPAPLTRLSSGTSGAYVWYWPDIEWWARRRGRVPLQPDDTAEQAGRSRQAEDDST